MKNSDAAENYASNAHYVYIYRDDKGRARYVGYGRGTERAGSHLSGSHNETLNEFIAGGRYTLEIAGPFGSEDIGRAIETALISCLKPDCNRAMGPWKWRFRPLGVPMSYAERLSLDPLGGDDFLRAQGALPRPVLLVYISDKNFSDGRVGYDPAQPPTDQEVLERIEKWWQLGPFLPHWARDQDHAPATLVGIHGRPGAQVVIGASDIDPATWFHPVRDGAYFRVRTCGPKTLDAHELRGRRVSRETGIRFGSLPTQFFVLLGLDGVARGGHPTRPRIPA